MRHVAPAAPTSPEAGPVYPRACAPASQKTEQCNRTRKGVKMGFVDRRQRRRRAAVIGGAAVAAKHHHDTKQAEEAAVPAEDPQPASADPAQAPPAGEGGVTPEALDELKQLGELHEQNVLTDEEFAREKARLLDSN